MQSHSWHHMYFLMYVTYAVTCAAEGGAESQGQIPGTLQGHSNTAAPWCFPLHIPKHSTAKQHKHFGLALHTHQFHNWFEPVSVCATLAMVLCFSQSQFFPPTASLGACNNAMHKHHSHYRQIPGKKTATGRVGLALLATSMDLCKGLSYETTGPLWSLKKYPKPKCNRKKTPQTPKCSKMMLHI